MSIKAKKISITALVLLITTITSTDIETLCKDVNTFNLEHKDTKMEGKTIQEVKEDIFSGRQKSLYEKENVYKFIWGGEKLLLRYNVRSANEINSLITQFKIEERKNIEYQGLPKIHDCAFEKFTDYGDNKGYRVFVIEDEAKPATGQVKGEVDPLDVDYYANFTTEVKAALVESNLLENRYLLEEKYTKLVYPFGHIVHEYSFKLQSREGNKVCNFKFDIYANLSISDNEGYQKNVEDCLKADNGLII